MPTYRRDREDGGDRDNRRSGGFGRDRGRGGGFGRDRGRGFGGRDRDFSRERRPLEMHEVTCAKCGKQCEVPFKPTSDKPVYCSDCFKQQDGGRDRGRGSSSGGVSAEQIKQINDKLDKILAALETLEIAEDEDSEDASVEE